MNRIFQFPAIVPSRLVSDSILCHEIKPRNARNSGAKNAQRFLRPALAQQVRTDCAGYMSDV